MIRVIYGDVLLLIDFCMNFFVICTTGIIARRKVKKTCIISASLIGGIYSVAKVFLKGNDIFDCVISLEVGMLMCYICFGGYKFLKTITVFYSVSALVGGIMFGIYYFLASYHTDIYGYAFEYAYSHLPVWMFIVLAAISMVISWSFAYFGRDSVEKGNEKIGIEFGGKSIEVNALIDSGNLVKEPISNKYVVIIGKKNAGELFNEEIYKSLQENDTERLLENKFRIIPVYGIDGKRKICYGIMPDSIFKTDKKTKIELDAYVAVSNSERFVDYDGIMHPAVLG